MTGVFLVLMIGVAFAAGFSAAAGCGCLARRSAGRRGWLDGYYTGWEARKEYESAARAVGRIADPGPHPGPHPREVRILVRTGGRLHWDGWEGPCCPD